MSNTLELKSNGLFVNGSQSGLARSPWASLLAGTDFATTAPGTQTVTMLVDLTSVIRPGMALLYTYNGTIYRGRVKTIAAGLLTLQGPPISTGAGLLTALSFSVANSAVVALGIAGSYGDTVTAVLYKAKVKRNYYWLLPRAYCVYFQGQHNTDAGTTQPKINVRTNSLRVSNNDSGNGIQLSTGLVANPDTAIDPSNYVINPGEVLELECSAAGNPTSGALDLAIQMMFVFD